MSPQKRVNRGRGRLGIPGTEADGRDCAKVGVVRGLVGTPSADTGRLETSEGRPGEQRLERRGPASRHGTETFSESSGRVKSGKMAEDVGRISKESKEMKE